LLLLRGIAGALLWIVSLLLILVGAILCLTVVLLPVGIPLLRYARRMIAASAKLMVRRAAASDSVKTTKRSATRIAAGSGRKGTS
jgi:hypothetical protein